MPVIVRVGVSVSEGVIGVVSVGGGVGIGQPSWKNQEPSSVRHNRSGKLRYSWTVDLDTVR